MINCNLTIILVNYNGFEDTKASLQSIAKTEGKFPYVVLVDNASTEKRDLEDLGDIYSSLKIIRNSENIGFGRANNIGINWARENLDFEYLLLLNNDTLVAPDTFNHLIAAFEIDPQIGITTSKTMYETNREIVWYGGGGINYKRGWPKITDFNQKPTTEGANKARYVSFVSGCVMMFSKESIKNLKGFDDDFFMYCEDLELSMRAQKVGYKLYYEPKSIVYHKVQGSFQKGKNKISGMKAKNPNLGFLFYHMKSNQWIAMRKSFKGMSFLKFNIYYWMEFIYINLKFFVQGRYDILTISTKTFNRILSY